MGPLEAAARQAVDTYSPPEGVADADRIRSALEALTDARQAADVLRTFVAVDGRHAVEHALKSGYRPSDLDGRPYSRSVVDKVRRDLGLPRQKPGPKPIVAR